MLIDVHCHANLYLTLDEVIKEAEGVGVEKIIAVAMSAISQERIIEITSKYNNIHPALGIHPEEVKMNQEIDNQLDLILKFIRKHSEKVCAIGEIGIDHHFIKNKELFPLQKKIFEQMLLLAQSLELPVNIHTKGAEKLIFDILPSYNIPNINVHWYSGPENLLKLGIERGYYFSITPAINYSPAVKKTASMVNIDYLLLESDGPVKYLGKTGTPAMIRDVLNKISSLKNIIPEKLENQICENTKKIFPKIFES